MNTVLNFFSQVENYILYNFYACWKSQTFFSRREFVRLLPGSLLSFLQIFVDGEDFVYKRCLQKKQLWLNICTNIPLNIYLDNTCEFWPAAWSRKNKSLELNSYLFSAFDEFGNCFEILNVSNSTWLHVKSDTLQISQDSDETRLSQFDTV